MAITALNMIGGITGTITFTDESNKTSTTEIMLPAATTLAQAQTFMLALAQSVELLSDAQIRKVSVSAGYDPAGADLAVQGNTVEEKAQFALKTAAGKTAKFAVPAAKQAYRIPTTRNVDLADPDIMALTTILTTGSGGVAPVDSNGSDLTQVLYGRIRLRSSLD